METNFLTQIKNDIQQIKETWLSNDSKIEKDYYAFNYWILNYLFHIDIENISDCITEYNDKGIDCFVHFEDSKELYIIQNCYFSEQTNLKREHVADFLTTPLTILSNNSYSRSKSLQEIFNNIKDKNDYTIYLYYYITKPKSSISNDILSLFDNPTFSYPFNVEIKLFDINEIQNIYEGERYEDVTHFEFDIKISRKELIEQNSEQHDKENNVNTAYTAVNIYEIFSMMEQSNRLKYDLFDKNIREYLGIKGKRGSVNKEILQTLKDEVERNRFFYYNNGITIICDDFKKSPSNGKKSYLKVFNPQIVNGCQTVNTIYEAIKSLSKGKNKADVIRDFKHCLVLLKIFKINKVNETEKKIYENIVRYTNTQAGITAKDFASKNDYFLNLKDDFLKRGFYLIVKQSDKNKYENDIETFERIKLISSDRVQIFNKSITKPKDLFIDLDKLLKCLMAFYFDGYIAFKYGSNTLHETSVTYYVNFSRKLRKYFTTDNMINLYLTFEKSGGTTYGRPNRTPIPYYLMDFLGRFIKSSENNNFDFDKANTKLSYLFTSKEIFEEIYDKFCQIIEDYSDEFQEINKVDYSTMTKNRKIDSDLVAKYVKLKLKDAKRYNWNNFIEYMS